MNLWHDVPLGENAPDEINVIIEIPKGSNNKYEIDKETGLIKLDRANYSAAAFPYDYGFAPQTLWEDNDALDVIVLTTYPLQTGILVNVRPVAVMEMIDSGESDFKIIGVPTEDKRWEDVQDLADINKHSLKEFQHFLETYKALKGKPAVVEIKGIKGKSEAIEAVKKSVKLYKEKFGK
ncbi:inorganic pyrophosphatase [Candidatus Kaiserbacteria bacterium RIFCSPHIGHO2_01_FULL_56_24]|uniref:Inorganic pyrophosphatase n=1 Tax=Candidatus Kaiserbacteria bacterium RIFCSPHIGHO2_01_FULL_56_24 TaxID=1798487 RepID=A0A1F6DAS0_9BACT|nr:MAG: inorganic pyrophosphatase [Candidatus Kaiserbacteria bacterium RIFCSPHIGHO2_01_FULL_56_24]